MVDSSQGEQCNKRHTTDYYGEDQNEIDDESDNNDDDYEDEEDTDNDSEATKFERDDNSSCQIFLGGSCNPTTWRYDVVIPTLNAVGITYYNPQVDEWTPEMIELECRAKQNAEILFFVIDKQTRSTVGMVESAFIGGTSRKFILVMLALGESAPILSPTRDYLLGRHPRLISMSSAGSGDTSSSDTPCNVTKSRTCTSITTSTSTASYITSSSSSSLGSSSLDLSAPKQVHQQQRQIVCSKRDSFLIDHADTSKHKNTTTCETVNNHNHPPATCAINSDSTATGNNSNRCFRLNNSSSSCLSSSSCSRSSSITTGPVKISGEYISWRELRELHRAKTTLCHLLSRRKVPIFSDIHQALNCAIECLRPASSNSKTSNSNTNINLPTVACELSPPSNLSQSSKDNHRQQHDSKLHNIEEVMTNVTVDVSKGTQISNDSACGHRLSFNDCCFFDEHNRPMSSELESRDIYLNFCDADNLWREQIALPLLQKLGLTCHHVVMNETHNDDDAICCVVDSIDEELNAMNACRILLFVISDKCRGLASMILAAHYMAKYQKSVDDDLPSKRLSQHRVVLCIQYLSTQEPVIVNGEQLTKTAVADYNRCRIYLSDHALKSHVSVFDTIETAIEYCAKLSFDSKDYQP